MQYYILAYHLAKIALVKKEVGKLTQVVERYVFCIRPVERELIAAIGVVCKVTGIYTVADNEELDVIKKPVKRSLVVSLNLVVCLF